MAEISKFAEILIEHVMTFIQSSIFELLIGTFVASSAGVLGAHYITVKLSNKRDTRNELMAVNSAISTAFEACNAFISFKEQNAIPVLRSYQSSLIIYNHYKDKGSEDGPVNLLTDYRVLSPINFPEEILIKLIYERINTNSYTKILTGKIINTYKSLLLVVSERNKIVENWKDVNRNISNFDNVESDMIAKYLGHLDSHGNMDTTYRDTVYGIYDLTDDCIFYSYEIIKELIKYGDNIKKKSKVKDIVIDEISFEIAKNKGLMPKEERYENIRNNVQNRKPKKPWYKLF
jgi:hypothetical protein